MARTANSLPKAVPAAFNSFISELGAQPGGNEKGRPVVRDGLPVGVRVFPAAETATGAGIAAKARNGLRSKL